MMARDYPLTAVYVTVCLLAVVLVVLIGWR